MLTPETLTHSLLMNEYIAFENQAKIKHISVVLSAAKLSGLH